MSSVRQLCKVRWLRQIFTACPTLSIPEIFRKIKKKWTHIIWSWSMDMCDTYILHVVIYWCNISITVIHIQISKPKYMWVMSEQLCSNEHINFSITFQVMKKRQIREVILFIYCFMFFSRIHGLYADISIAKFEHGEIFIVPHILWLFKASSEWPWIFAFHLSTGTIKTSLLQCYIFLYRTNSTFSVLHCCRSNYIRIKLILNIHFWRWWCRRQEYPSPFFYLYPHVICTVLCNILIFTPTLIAPNHCIYSRLKIQDSSDFFFFITQVRKWF